MPEASVAVHVTVVVPTGNDPSASFVRIGEGSTRSITVTFPYRISTIVSEPVASAVIVSGAVISGGVVSTTSIVNDAEPELPAESVAMHVTAVKPIGNESPEL